MDSISRSLSVKITLTKNDLTKTRNIMAYHVLPVNDLKEHTQETTCECEPTVTYENGEMIIIHNSYDGREGVEWANEILKQTTS